MVRQAKRAADNAEAIVVLLCYRIICRLQGLKLCRNGLSEAEVAVGGKYGDAEIGAEVGRFGPASLTFVPSAALQSAYTVQQPPRSLNEGCKAPLMPVDCQ